MKQFYIIVILFFSIIIAHNSQESEINIDQVLSKEGVYIDGNTKLDFDSEAKINNNDLKILIELTTIKYLSINTKTVSDEGFINIKYLKNLEALSLTESNFTDTSMQYIKDLVNIYRLDLAETKITDKGLEYLKNLTNIKDLYLWNTNITDKGVKLLEHLDLRELNLENTKITDACIPTLLKFKNLETLYIKGTKISQDGIEKLNEEFDKRDPITFLYHDLSLHRKIINKILDLFD